MSILWCIQKSGLSLGNTSNHSSSSCLVIHTVHMNELFSWSPAFTLIPFFRISVLHLGLAYVPNHQPHIERSSKDLLLLLTAMLLFFSVFFFKACTSDQTLCVSKLVQTKHKLLNCSACRPVSFGVRPPTYAWPLPQDWEHHRLLSEARTTLSSKSILFSNQCCFQRRLPISSLNMFSLKI